jgi:hypothetical protein
MQPPIASNDWDYEPAAVAAPPPPPPPPGVRAEANSTPVTAAHSGVTKSSPSSVGKGHPFDAEIEVGEIDERGRPGSAWAARGREVSRERLVLMSRRMVRLGCLVIVAVHMVDDEPMPLFGKVIECEYEAEGLHRIIVEFRPTPWDTDLRAWMAERART